MPMTLRERQKNLTRSHIAAVAAELIAEKGYQATSIDDIASAAGSSRATLYAYFESKDTILAQLQREMWATIGQRYREFGELEVWNRASVSTWLVGTIEVWRQNSQRFKACMAVQQLSIDAEHAIFHETFIALLTANHELWVRFDANRIDRRASLLIRMTESYLTTWLLRGWEVDEELSTTTMVDVWLDVLHIEA